MTRRSPPDLARLLLDKGSQDLTLMRAVLDNPEVADASIAFHAQQSVEKS